MRLRSLLASLTIVVLASLTLVARPVAVGADPGTDEQVFVAKINGLRALHGLPALVLDPELRAQARAWAQVMADGDRLRHASDFSTGISTEWDLLGENVGRHGVHDVDALFNAFVDSPSHLANLLNERYDRVGVGVVYGTDGTMWTTHRFLSVDDAAVASPATEPTTTTPPTTPAPPTTPPPTIAPPTTGSTSPSTTAPPTTPLATTLATPPPTSTPTTPPATGRPTLPPTTGSTSPPTTAPSTTTQSTTAPSSAAPTTAASTPATSTGSEAASAPLARPTTTLRPRPTTAADSAAPPSVSATEDGTTPPAFAFTTGNRLPLRPTTPFALEASTSEFGTGRAAIIAEPGLDRFMWVLEELTAAGL